MKRRTVCLNAMVFLTVSGGAQVASAHLPIFDDGTAVDAEHALVISDIPRSSRPPV
jgi:hypothetical protein